MTLYSAPPRPSPFPRQAWRGLRGALLLTRWALVPVIVLTTYEVLGIVYDAGWVTGQALAADPAAFEQVLQGSLVYWLLGLGPVYALLHVLLGTTTDRLRAYPRRRRGDHVLHAVGALLPLVGSFLTLNAWREHADEIEHITGRKGLASRVAVLSTIVPFLFGLGLWVAAIAGVLAAHHLGPTLGRAILAAGFIATCAGPFLLRLWAVEQLRQAMEAAETHPSASRAAYVEPTAG